MITRRCYIYTDPAPSTLLQPRALHGDWHHQHPIGSGAFGALVGGNIRSEFVPVSAAGFYARKAHVEGGFYCWLWFIYVDVQ
jgi:hypothetical protein